MRGLNRLATFFGFQVAAAIVAVGIWLAGRSLRPGSAGRWLSRAPGLLAALLAATIAASIPYAYLSKPDPQDPPPRPATAPVAAPTN